MFFYLSKMLYFLIHPTNLMLLGIVLGIFALKLKLLIPAKSIFAITLFGTLFVTLVPAGDIMKRHLENRFPSFHVMPPHVDGVIVLGGSVNPILSHDRRKLALQGNIERLFEFSNFAKKYPGARVVFTGGSGSLADTELKEAHFAEEAMIALGIEPGRVIYEDQSRNTVENALLSKKLLEPEEKEIWILITSAAHMPRAMGVFRKIGWNMIAWPVDYTQKRQEDFSVSFNFARNAGRLASALHEVVGLLVYYLTGKTSELYPSA
ncbi:MAG: YdcF family protein [Cohaesibacteraceae bacterium]|nr:YdcF family protein [Cohaesibacteraceae bacterium]